MFRQINLERPRLASEMRSQGVSVREIATRLGVTRQRVYQLFALHALGREVTYSLSAVAQMLGVTYHRARQAAELAGLKHLKPGAAWKLTEQDLAAIRPLLVRTCEVCRGVLSGKQNKCCGAERCRKARAKEYSHG